MKPWLSVGWLVVFLVLICSGELRPRQTPGLIWRSAKVGNKTIAVLSRRYDIERDRRSVIKEPTFSQVESLTAIEGNSSPQLEFQNGEELTTFVEDKHKRRHNKKRKRRNESLKKCRKKLRKKNRNNGMDQGLQVECMKGMPLYEASKERLEGVRKRRKLKRDPNKKKKKKGTRKEERRIKKENRKKNNENRKKNNENRKKNNENRKKNNEDRKKNDRRKKLRGRDVKEPPENFPIFNNEVEIRGKEACQYENLKICSLLVEIFKPKSTEEEKEDNNKCFKRKKFLECMEQVRKNQDCSDAKKVNGSITSLREAIRNEIWTNSSCILTEVLNG